MTLDRSLPCACPYPLWYSDLPLSPNSTLHVGPQISTVRPPLVVVGLIWGQPSKKSSSRSVILAVSVTLASTILTCDTILISMKDESCTVLRSPGPILVSWIFLCNESTQISAIPANEFSSSSMCETFGKRTESGSHSCGYSRTIRGQSSNCCVVGEELSSQNLCLTYRVVPSRPLQGRWCLLAFTCEGCLARQCGDFASGLD